MDRVKELFGKAARIEENRSHTHRTCRDERQQTEFRRYEAPVDGVQKRGARLAGEEVEGRRR